MKYTGPGHIHLEPEMLCSLAKLSFIYHPWKRGEGKMEGVPFIDDYISTQEQVVDYLDSASLPFLVLHHTPSTLTLRYSMSPVMFPTCKDPLLRQG